MILGLSLSTFTTIHVVISVIALASGVVVAAGLAGGRQSPGWAAVFLATTVLTSASGFLFEATAVLPSHVFGVISLIALAVALAGLYVFRLHGAWRWLYVAGALLALYLNAFVAVVQAFQKIPALQPLAPTQSEPPFAVAQFVLLLAFVAIGVMATRRFRPGTAAPA
jgi:hypothetical protein